jgi:hypothetical protein
VTWRESKSITFCPDLSESDQRSGCSDELAQIKQRFSFGLLQENFLLLNFGFYFAGIAERCNEKQVPVAAGKGACPSLRQGCRGVAFTGAKRRPLTKEADDQAQVWPGRAEAVFVEVLINRTAKVSEAMTVEISGSIHPTDRGTVP